MKKLKIIVRVALVLTVITVGIFVWNYLNSVIRTDARTPTITNIAQQPITVMNWNLGYAGLGEESDFVMDGGTNLYPPSRAVVEKNLAGIQSVITTNPADIYLFQEVAKPDQLNLGVNVLEGVDAVLVGRDRLFSTDFDTWFIPRSWALHHGLGSYAGINTDPPQVYRLPNQEERLGGVIRRQYHFSERRFTDRDGVKWAVINVHLAAYDQGGEVRNAQLDALLGHVQALYAQGWHVVVGGDWNMQLTPTDFPHTTDDEYLTWLHPFPTDHLQEGWTLGFDPTVPTVRSNERPYRADENFTTIIDGFLVSPNVKIQSVRTLNLGFAYSDHQPQIAEFVQNTSQ